MQKTEGNDGTYQFKLNNYLKAFYNINTVKIMINKHNDLKIIKDLLKKMEIDPHARYLTAKQVEIVYGIPRKTTLNRSNLPSKNPRYLPSVKLKGGRLKYFERKVVERFFCTASNAGGQK